MPAVALAFLIAGTAAAAVLIMYLAPVVIVMTLLVMFVQWLRGIRDEDSRSSVLFRRAAERLPGSKKHQG